MNSHLERVEQAQAAVSRLLKNDGATAGAAVVMALEPYHLPADISLAIADGVNRGLFRLDERRVLHTR